ncbi:MAG: hypothetical protein RLZZ70_217 [Candidatus Parcubacteria bacterium]|jgi:hypothetical protein
MAFGDFEFDHKAKLTPDQILNDFDLKKDHKTKVIHFLLVKDCGLRPETEFSFETRGGQKVNVVHFRDRGITATYTITATKIELSSKESLNDTESGNVDALEEEIINEHIQILKDYFSLQPDDRPEE